MTDESDHPLFGTLERMAELYEVASKTGKAYSAYQWRRLLKLKGLDKEADELEEVHKRLGEQLQDFKDKYGLE